MDDTLDVKPIVEGNAAKPPDVGTLGQALIQLEAEVAFDHTHESWFSIVRFWIQELRWRRAFWEKMGRPSFEESDS